VSLSLIDTGPGPFGKNSNDYNWRRWESNCGFRTAIRVKWCRYANANGGFSFEN
jgi:hypothetical protein